jgi:bifunctional ADP-heptose synthase (sugar kinase/adenylyltransferase)
MLTDALLEQILERIPTLSIGVLGDLFLDRYLDIDAELTERSIETGLDAYQVVRVRSSPGAVGTVINNLVALGVSTVWPVTVIGDDGEGYELSQALTDLGVSTEFVQRTGERRTPTYTKPMLHESGRVPRELNRLDIKNRMRLSATAQIGVMDALTAVWPRVNALVVLDQVSEIDCGIVTTAVRERLAGVGGSDPKKIILVDSREHIGEFRSVWLKPNEAEAIRAVPGVAAGPERARHCAIELARRVGRPVFCTCGDQGIFVVDSRSACEWTTQVPAYPVAGPVDIVGAGDSTSSGIACALAAGASLAAAGAFGSLVASITIQQIGTTGTATPEQVRQRWRQVHA